MAGPQRMTEPTRRVLKALLTLPAEERYMYRICKVVDLHIGSAHAVLTRLEACGWATSEYESEGMHVNGRPARRFFTLTDEGIAGAEKYVQH